MSQISVSGFASCSDSVSARLSVIHISDAFDAILPYTIAIR